MLATSQIGGNRESQPVRIWEEPACDVCQDATIVIPKVPENLAYHYDLTLSHPETDMVCFKAFEGWLAEEAASRGLSCALIHDRIVREAINRLEQGRLSIGYHLDYYALWHIEHDPYAGLAHAVEASGGKSVNTPHRSRQFTNKAFAHAVLQQSGLGVPATLLVEPGADLSLKAEEIMQALPSGSCLYAKPANGFGSQGVVKVEKPDAPRLITAIQAAQQINPQDTVLIQHEIQPPRLECTDGIARSAYWRILYCLGEIVPFWWSKRESEHGKLSYRPLHSEEIARHGLQPVLEYAADLADLCQLNWFSTEVCLSTGEESSKHQVQGSDGRAWPVLAIDYVNDQCDVDVQSRWPGAPPDAVVKQFAARFAEAALKQKQLLRFRSARQPPTRAA